MTTCAERRGDGVEARMSTRVPSCTRCAAERSYFEDEVWRRARPHCGSEDAVVVRVDQRLVQVQNQNLPLYCIWRLSHEVDT
ncbi:hypothetical protein EYF80_021882 [Liparis tanakae]|uniref:Uncharacterized protein n=1 Tax=Liparis tanakae TaxID=230148 RepID=A0A4Z2HSF7_9TELE|nr:hypothetical protein EYF80_021882 [Liparis tanakae]